MHAQAIRPSVTICVALLVVLAACEPTSSPPLAAVEASPSPTALPPTAATATPTATAPPLPSSTVISPTPTATQSLTLSSTLRTVTGRATLVDSGAPVPDVQVAARYVEPAIDPSTGVVVGEATPLPEVVAVTDASGSYALRVPTRTDTARRAPADEFLLQGRGILIRIVAPPRHVVIRQLRTATLGVHGPPAVSADGDSTGVDVLLAPAFLVTGRILRGDGTAAPKNGRVIAYRSDDPLVFGFGRGGGYFEPRASADATGRYELPLARGVYVLAASDGDDDNYRARWWSHEPAVFQASLLVVDGDRTGIDVVLVQASSLVVRVQLGQVPFGGAVVTAYRGGDARCCALVGRATTGFGFAVLQLPEGMYRVRLEPPATSPLRPQWWNGALDFAAATDITVMGSSGARIEVDLANSP